MPAADYHAHPALSRSVLDRIRKSPRHLRHYLEHGAPDTPAYLQGRVLHRLLLEPTLFWQETVVWTGGDKVKNAGAWKVFKAENAGKDIITEAERAAYIQVEESFFNKTLTKGLLQGAVLEGSAFWKKRDVECKARPDVVKDGIVYDIKFMADATQFERDAYKYGFHRQAAWYLDGVTAATGKVASDFAFVVIEKEAPYDVQVFWCEPDFIAAGRQENELNFELYERCLRASNWPGYPDVLQKLSLPRWVTQ